MVTFGCRPMIIGGIGIGHIGGMTSRGGDTWLGAMIIGGIG